MKTFNEIYETVCEILAGIAIIVFLAYMFGVGGFF